MSNGTEVGMMESKCSILEGSVETLSFSVNNLERFVDRLLGEDRPEDGKTPCEHTSRCLADLVDAVPSEVIGHSERIDMLLSRLEGRLS